MILNETVVGEFFSKKAVRKPLSFYRGMLTLLRDWIYCCVFSGGMDISMGKKRF